MTTCTDVREQLLAYQAGRLTPAVHDAVRSHLEGCAACAHEEAAEQALTELLERRLPQHPAPLALKRRIAAGWPTAAAAAPRRWRRTLLPAVTGGVVALVVMLLVQFPWRATPDPAAMATEAVNDHLRIVERRELPVTSSLVHQVKPWFTGRIDFAPVVPFAGDADFPLRGGAVERFLDRQAAVFVYGRRLHTISLLVFRADGLSWPRDAGQPRTTSVRGFNVILWRAGDLGYALVSDVDARDLAELARRLGA
jgi:anti-sigma factor (TIGR02949 family)